LVLEIGTMAKAKTTNDEATMRSVKSLTPNIRNSRKHGPEQVESIAASMKEFGFTIPVLIDEKDEIIAGHGRLLAASKLYDEGTSIKALDGELLPDGMVPVIVARGWTPEQKRAYMIADNKLTEASAWDEEMLRAELGDLKLAGFDLSLTGFTGDELNVVLNGWNPDVRNQPEPDHDAGMTATIKVRCPMPQKDDVAKLVREALADVEGVEIA
jgi:hypothetical protein